MSPEDVQGQPATPIVPVAARPIIVPGAPPRLPAFDLSVLPRSAAALDLGLIVLVALLLPIGTEVAVGLFVDQAVLAGFKWAIIVDKWLDALLVVGLTAYVVYRHGLSAAAFGLQREGLLRQALWPSLLSVYALFLAVVLLVMGLALIFPQIEQDLRQRTEFMETLPLEDFTATLLLLVPVSIHEELLFRGLLIPYLRRVGCGWTAAILLSSAVFGLLHLTQGWFGVLQIFGVGVVLGLFFLIFLSLLAVILTHLLFNLVQFQVARHLLPWAEEVAGPGLILP